MGHGADPGQWLKLGLVFGTRSVRRYRRPWKARPPSPSGWIFLANKPTGSGRLICLVQTITFKTLYVLFFISHAAGGWFTSRSRPTAARVGGASNATSIGCQPRYLIHDRDRVYEADFSSERGRRADDAHIPSGGP